MWNMFNQKEEDRPIHFFSFSDILKKNLKGLQSYFKNLNLNTYIKHKMLQNKKIAFLAHADMSSEMLICTVSVKLSNKTR